MSNRAPDLTEKVIGYRCWRVDKDGNLWPLFHASAPWKPGANRASCGMASGWAYAARFGEGSTHEHRTPDKHCHCGWNAAHDKADALGHAHRVQKVCTVVVGPVTGWGRMRVHPDGFRAEYAEPLAFALPPGERVSWRQRRWLKKASKRYGIPLMPYESLETVAREHGSPVPDDLRPEPYPVVSGSGYTRVQITGSTANFTTSMANVQASMKAFGQATHVTAGSWQALSAYTVSGVPMVRRPMRGRWPVAITTGVLLGLAGTALGLPFAVTLTAQCAAGFALGWFWPRRSYEVK